MLKTLIVINLILLINMVLAGFFAQFNLRRWLIKDGSRRRSMMMMPMMMSYKGSKMADQEVEDDSEDESMADVPMESIIQDSWGSESSQSNQQSTCNCNCGGGGDKGKKGKKSKGGGGGTMAIVIPKYEYFDVPMAKEIETENLGKVTEKSVSYKSGWGDKGDSGW